MSGDPQPDGAVIWARLAAPAVAAPLDATWEVATDNAFTAIVAGGPLSTDGGIDYALKVAVTTLSSNAWFFYRFLCGGVSSPVGRLRTSPTVGAPTDALTFAWCSCQQRGDSLYNAHTAMAAEPGLDFWMHLGDYIYVNDSGTLTLPDYRDRYHDFKVNSRLQTLQATVPTVAMFDDGEFVNGIDRTLDPIRKANALSAWFENFPVIPPGADPTRAYRPLAWGNLADVLMLDVRQYRDPAIDAIDTTTPEGAAIFDPNRTNLGPVQKAWVKDALLTSAARWKLLGNPYNFGPWRLQDLDEPWPRPPGIHPNEGVYAPNEAWDDYWAERRELLEHVASNDVENFLSFSGHTHIWIADALKPDWDDPASPMVGYDFTCGSLTADPDLIRQSVDKGNTAESAFAFYLEAGERSRQINPFQAYLNFIHQGYGLATITQDEAVIDFKAIDTYNPDAEPDLLVRFVIPAGDPCGMTVEYFDEPAYGITGTFVRPGHVPWVSACPTAIDPPVGPTPTTTNTPPSGAVSATPTFTG